MPAFRYQNGDRPLDGFTIEHGLGRGGFGEVYYAVSDSGRQVALKVVQNYEEVELRGIGHCMNLKSQHLVSIFDVKHNDRNEPFVIMEYVDGPSLRELLDDTPNGMGATKAAFFMRELAKGITYLHDNGVVHRDMKPHNVFFEDGIVKIGDYSLSKIISSSHRSGHTMTVGTVHYMAPEIGMGRYDARVDIYALGIMLYEMLTGSPPFVGESMGEVIMKHVTADPDLSQIEEPYARTIKKALEKDPEKRFQTAAEMVESLFGADHVKNSVTAFNPMELSVIADKVAKKVVRTRVAAGGVSSHGMNMSPAAMPTEVYGRSNDSTADATDALSAHVMPEPAPAMDVPADNIIGHGKRKHERVIGELIDHDPITKGRRITLTVAALLGVTVYVALSSPYSATSSDALARMSGFFLPMFIIGWIASWRGIKAQQGGWRPIGGAVTILLLSLPPIFVIAPMCFGHAPHAPTWLFGFVPLLAVNWRARTAPDRDMRLHVSLALSCGLAAGAIAIVMSAEPLAAIAMASGAAFAAQMLSPFHRLSGVQESRNPAAQEYRSAKKEQVAEIAHPVSASLVKAKREIEDVAAGFREPSGTADEAPATAELVDEDVEPEPSPHNQVTILLLNLIYLMFPVVGGLHRLAVGRVISGLIWMVTGGLFFVGQIYDAYMIITGQFLDSEGRPVGPYQKREATTPVNHLSGIPAAIKPTHPGAFALNSIGIACVFVGCGLVLASLVVTGLVTFADHRAFNDMSESMGSSDWPEVTHQIATIVACGVLAIGAVSFMFARRRHSASHVLRALFGCFCIGAAFVCLWVGVEGVDWQDAYIFSKTGSPLLAIKESFLDDDMLASCVGGGITCLAGASILAWPARKQPSASIEEKQS